MSRSHRRSMPFCLGLTALLAASSPALAEPPLRVQFRAELAIPGAGDLYLRGVFRADGARIAVAADQLPPPASGEYDLVLAAGDLNLVDLSLSQETEGSFTAQDEVAGDQRLEALSLDSVTLYDGDEIVAASSEIETSAHLRFRADLRFESFGRPTQVSVGGLAGRRLDGSARSVIKIVTGILDPGEYEVRLEGVDDARIDIPFSVVGTRQRRHVTQKEWTDRMEEMARLETALLFKDGNLVATEPLGPVR